MTIVADQLRDLIGSAVMYGLQHPLGRMELEYVRRGMDPLPCERSNHVATLPDGSGRFAFWVQSSSGRWARHLQWIPSTNAEKNMLPFMKQFGFLYLIKGIAQHAITTRVTRFIETMAIAPLYVGGLPVPSHSERSGAMSRSIGRYLTDRTGGEKCPSADLHLVRCYVQYYLAAPCWLENASDIDANGWRDLMVTTGTLEPDSDQIAAVIKAAMDFGIDPL